jgi:hypothetical protein
MAMQQRERALALGLGLVAGLIFVYWAFGKYTSMFSTRQADVDRIEKQVDVKKTKLARIEKAIHRRRQLEKRSLPTNKTDAENRYGDWLLSLVKEKLSEPSVTPRPPITRAKGFEALDFEVKGQGTLEQVTKVLHDFYASNHLHQITSLIIKPQEKSGTLDLTMQVEAIILPGTVRKDALTTEPGDNLALESFADYQKAIVNRNLFSEYKPPAPQRQNVAVERKEPTFDLAKLAYVTNIGHGIDQRPTAWIYERNSNKTTKLFVGDEFQIAGITGKVQRIDVEDLKIEVVIDGKSVSFSQYKSLGDTLAERQKMQK